MPQNPLAIVGDDGQTITLGDGTQVPKALLPPEVMQKVGIAPAGSVTKPGLVLPSASPPSGAVDLGAGSVPEVPKAPLLGQGTETVAANGTGLPVSTPIGAPRTDPAMDVSNVASPQGGVATIQEKQTQFTGGVKTSPQDIAAQRALATDEKRVATDQATIASDQAKDEAQILADQNLQLQARRAKFAEQQKAIDDEIAAQRSKVDTAIEDWRNTPTKPQGSAGEDIGNIIASALGAIGSSLTGGPNFALDIVNKGIDRKIAAQRAELEKKGKNVDLAKNQLAYLQDRGLNAAQAENAVRQMYYEDTASALKAKAAQYKSPQLLKQAEQVALSIDGRLQATERAQHEAAQGRATTIVAEKQKQLGASLGDVKDLSSMANQNEDIKAYRTARQNADSFADLRKAGADGAAISDFIANGLKQGSFSTTFIDMLRKRGAIDKAGEYVREKFSGGYEPAMLDQIQAGLNNKLGTAAQRAKGPIQELVKMGLNPALIIGGQSRGEVANDLGLTPRK